MMTTRQQQRRDHPTILHALLRHLNPVGVTAPFTVIPLTDPKSHRDGMAAIMGDATKHFEEVRALKQRLAAAGHQNRTRLNAPESMVVRDRIGGTSARRAVPPR